MYYQDTIAAIATPPGTGGVGIVRVSGPEATQALARMLDNEKGPYQPRRMYYGSFRDQKGNLVDHGYHVWFKAPASFTGEDVVEFHCHGGMLILSTILRELFAQGIRAARPGEFSQRAFLNGKLDLVQAEAIMDMVSADSRKALDIAVGHYAGGLSTKIKSLKAQVTSVLARLEVSMDYPDMDINEEEWHEFRTALGRVAAELAAMADSFDEGRLYRDGIATVILGKPNVGKSSLLNMLSGEERAIVTEVPGTTRDVVEIPVNIRGIPLRLMDTAGIRETGDMVERIGVAKAREAAGRADLTLLVMDRSRPAEEDDRRLMELAGKSTLVVLNKADLPGRFCMDKKDIEVVEISALTGQGVEELKGRIYDIFVQAELKPGELPLTNPRHYQGIEKARRALVECLQDWPLKKTDMLAQDLRQCWEYLGEITGGVWNDDLLNYIFSRFCLGK